MPVRTRFLGPAGCFGPLFLLVIAGCGGPKTEFAEVQGTVTLHGRPLPGVKVAFYPDNEGAIQLPYATGMTDASGAYTLTTDAGKPGALVGKNRVVLNWPLPERDPDKPPPPPNPPIPKDFTAVGKTPFIFVVKSGPLQTIDLPLP